MRDFNKVSTTLWRSKKFRALPDDQCRFVYLYILTCPHGNSAGCFDLNPHYACGDLGCTEKAYRKTLDILCKVGLILWDNDENTIFVTNWEEFNEPTNPKHAIGLLGQLDQASSVRLKTIAFHAFLERFKVKKFDQDSSLRKAIDICLQAYPKPIERVLPPDQSETETEIETKTEIKTRPDQTKTETRESPRAALRTVAAEGRDGLTPERKATPPPGAPSPELQRIVQTKLKNGSP